MGGVVKIGRKFALECWCCGCRSRPAPDEPTAARWAHVGHWDVPGQLPDGEPYEGYFRCPRCVDLNRWPLECDGWFGVGVAVVVAAMDCDTATDEMRGPTIRLADGDDAVTLPLDEVPEALIVE